MRDPAGRRRGLALLVILGILVVLSILAISFARLMSVERTAARTRSDQVQAELAAEAGFHEAARVLHQVATANPWSDPVDRWVYRNDLDNDVGTGHPVERAVHPSFEAGAYPVGHPLAGLGYSRILPSPDGRRELSVAVKIESNAGKIHLNGGELGGPPGSGYNAVLARFLNDLVFALKQDPTYRSSNLPNDAGTQIMAARPAEGWRSVNDLAAVIGRAGRDELADFVCVHSWADPSTIRPDPMVANATWGTAAPRSQPLELVAEPRSPIDVNVACRPVLVASLMGVQARLLERQSLPRASGAKNGYAWRVVETTAIDHTLARDVADSVLLRRETDGAFRTWDEFDQWLIGLSASLPSLTPTLVDVVRAAVNPNTRLNKFNPDRVLVRAVDKSDLSAYKTEWCLGPTGYFRIDSVGRVVVESDLIAQSLLSSEYRLFQVVRHTTQADFASARTYADDDVDLLPEAMRDSARAATEDGQITLAKAPNDGDDAALSFRLPLVDGLAADVGSPTAPRSPETTIEDFGPATVVGPGQADPSDLLADGVHFDMPAGQFYMFDAAANRPWIEGGLSFWYKPNHHWSLVKEYKEPASVGLFHVLQPLSDRKTTIVHQVKIWWFDDRDRPELFSRIRIYTTKRAAAPEIGGFAPIPAGYDYDVELTYRYTTWFPKTDPAASMTNEGITRVHGLEWEQGDWHHVGIRWTNPTEHYVWIDGCAMKPMLWGKGVYDPAASYLWNGVKMVSQIQVGGRFIEQYGIGGAIDLEETYALGTVRGVRIYQDPVAVDREFPVSGGQAMDMSATPEVYLPPSGLSGRFAGRIQVPAGATLGTIAWTELRPRKAYEIYDSYNMAGRVYAVDADPDRPDVRVRFQPEAAGVMADVAGDGEGGPLGQRTADGQLAYEVLIDDRNFQPLNVAPVLDDLTVTYLDPAVLTWSFE